MKLKDIYNKIKENTTTEKIMYHGSPEEHDFKSTGYIEKGTFFAKDINTAKSFGKYIYECVFKPDIKILNITTKEGAKWVLDTFGELYDTYYDEDDDNYLITDIDTLRNHSDSWEAIENTPDVVSGIEGEGYDGYAATEGGPLTYFIFDPVIDKLESFRLIT